MKDKSWWMYDWDGKSFIAQATSLNNFCDIMNRNSNYKRFSSGFLKAHDACEIELKGSLKLLVEEMTNEGFEGVWIHKFFKGRNYRKLLELDGQDGVIIPRKEYEKLTQEKNNKISDELEFFKDILSEIRSLVERKYEK